MTLSQTPKRYPTVQCWIKHILEATYLADQNVFFSIFGKIKRIRLIATILDKREIISEPKLREEENEDLDSEEGVANRIEFDLDDTTGLIRASIFNKEFEDYNDFQTGDIVEVIGLLRRWKTYTSLNIEIIKKVDNPNLVLLRNAEIIKRIQLEELHNIPQIQENFNEIDDISEEINYNSFLENNDHEHSDSRKNEIFLLIKDYSKDGIGISFKELQKRINLSIEELKKYLNELIMESKIYQSEENIYESYDF
ncbi:MAG: OB-fold nucleic acid binding domain-containing protein [Promethearchaeota archaeon]